MSELATHELAADERYLAFDLLIDDYLEGECSFETAIERYKLVADFITAEVVEQPGK